jgi:hypothetical protein
MAHHWVLSPHKGGQNCRYLSLNQSLPGVPAGGHRPEAQDLGGLSLASLVPGWVGARRTHTDGPHPFAAHVRLLLQVR